MTDKPRSVRVPEDLWQAAKTEAKRRGETVTDAICRALRNYTRGERRRPLIDDAVEQLARMRQEEEQDILSEDERRELNQDLAHMAQLRRRAEAEAANTPLA